LTSELSSFAQDANTMMGEGCVNGDRVADFKIAVSTGLTLQSTDILSWRVTVPT